MLAALAGTWVGFATGWAARDCVDLDLWYGPEFLVDPGGLLCGTVAAVLLAGPIAVPFGLAAAAIVREPWARAAAAWSAAAATASPIGWWFAWWFAAMMSV